LRVDLLEQFGRCDGAKLGDKAGRSLSAERSEQWIATLLRHRLCMEDGHIQLPDQRDDADQYPSLPQSWMSVHWDILAVMATEIEAAE
jgi:hypothetical protein